MKKRHAIILAAVLQVIVGACTPMIYGVPQDRWDLMSEPERIAAMETYKERQIAYQQAAAERARLQAIQEDERRLQLEEDLHRRRHERIEMIYTGRAGQPGDLLEVSLHGGLMRLNGQKRGYEPVSFLIADGELKSVPVSFSRGRQDTLYVLYENHHLWLDIDETGRNTRQAGHLIFKPEWADGITFPRVNSHNALDLRNVTVDVSIVPIRAGRRYHRVHQQATVIVKDTMIKEPPTRVIVREKVVERPDDKVIRQDRSLERPRPLPDENGHDRHETSREDTAANSDRRPAVHSEDNAVDGDDPSADSMSGRIIRDVVRKKQDRVVSMSQESAREGEANRGRGPHDAAPQQGAEKEKSKRNNDKGRDIGRVHVELNGGKIIIDGKHRPFRPVNFWIGEGEARAVELVAQNGTVRHLDVRYQNGLLTFDGQPGNNKSVTLDVVKMPSVRVSSRGDVSLDGVLVKISTR